MVSTTALHWLSAAELRDLYVTLAGLLRPGGLFLDGDHLHEDETSQPGARRGWTGRSRSGKAGGATRTGTPAAPRTGTSGGRRWRRTRRWPTAAAERSRGLVHHGDEGAQLAAHTSALRAAGFAEVGTLWQRGSSRVLCGVR